MKKIISSIISICVFSAFMFAGDVASFVEEGWSSDGKTFVFGQYGKTDKDFQGWAELIEVNIEKNDYEDNGYFSIKPSSVTKGKNGGDVYESLKAKSFYSTKPLNLKKTEPDQILYLCEDVYKKGSDEIIFKDFLGSDVDNPLSFSVTMNPSITGSGANAKSSFYILIEKKDKNGNVIASQKVGNPEIRRKGVTNYKIEKILSDKTGKKIIFVVEKTMEDKTGINVRYMVEACILNENF
ncbi:MAG: DUF2259 domain-containing protein [Treponema sp.]|nr:DUF2259 domain-containing protein [Treponema sp.]